jgi:hypothetical protein
VGSQAKSGSQEERIMSQDTVSPDELERLQIRAIAFRDRADELLAIFSDNDEGEQPARNDIHLLSDADAASRALTEILQAEAFRVKIPIPDWFGPKEQLENQIAFLGAMVMDEADQLLSEVEAHTGHSYPCRCDELLAVFDRHIQPALAEWDNLMEAVKNLCYRARRTR